MKKSNLFTLAFILLTLSSCSDFRRDGGGNWALDVTSLAIGVVIGVIIGYLVGKRSSK